MTKDAEGTEPASDLSSAALPHRRRLDVVFIEHRDGTASLPSVSLLIDGFDHFAHLSGGSYIGLEPSDLLSQSVLIEPLSSPHEVTLSRCDCGELGCGAVVARCFRRDDQVIWDQFGAGNPRPRQLDDPNPGTDALIFALEQYSSAMRDLQRLAFDHD